MKEKRFDLTFAAKNNPKFRPVTYTLKIEIDKDDFDIIDFLDVYRDRTLKEILDLRVGVTYM